LLLACLGRRKEPVIDVSLEIPDKVRELQIKLYRKAKNEPEFRFYLLYDKVYRKDVLLRAWVLARANHGAPGVDGKSFEDIESEGVLEWLDGLGKDLHDKTYKPLPVRHDSEAGRRRTTTGYPDDSGPGGANRRETDTGADL
jgi:hypothetical protein